MTRNLRTALAFALLLLMAAGIGFGVSALDEGQAADEPMVELDASTSYTDRLLGDDNGDGRIEEDEEGFDCRTMGNGQCGQVEA